MQYTKVASDAFEKLQLNAGILARSFAPATGTVGEIIGATTGGVTFASNPTYTDFGEDVDNVPANTKQLKRIQSFDPALSGTFLTVTPAVVKDLIGSADVSNTTQIVPRNQLTNADFKDVWWIGDYSDKNSGATTAGYVAIHVMNGLNTSGFQIQSEKDGKGKFAFEYHGHYDIESIDTVPFEVYVKAGSSGSATPEIKLQEHAITIANGSTYDMAYYVTPAGASVTWSSSATGKASVSNGTITGAATGNAIITASITDSGVTYSDTCTVIVV